MDCNVKAILKLFLSKQTELNDLLNNDIEQIKEELTDQDEINETVANLLSVITERINDIESRLNKLERR